MSNIGDDDAYLDALLDSIDYKASEPKSPPPPDVKQVACDPKWRPNSFLLFALLDKAMFGLEHEELKEYSRGLQEDNINILASLGALTIDGKFRHDASRFKDAWYKNDLDWFHNQFLTLPPYYETVMAIKQKKYEALHGRSGYLTLARRLGQVARLNPSMNLFVGDAKPSNPMIQLFFNAVLPNMDDKITVYELCVLAAINLGLTPARFETAVARYKKSYNDFPFQGKMIGIREPGYDELVVRLDPLAFSFEDVSSGTLRFGGSMACRELVRVG